MKFYTGIGSRITPLILQEDINKIVDHLNDLGFTLRSGGAPGADSMFERKAISKEIFLPWMKFNGNPSNLHDVCQKSLLMAKKYHPSWNRLSVGAKKLMARNSYQVLGKDLETPSEFVICWTDGGGISGGTGQALRIAKDFGIPIYNLYNMKSQDIINLIK